MSSKQEGGAPPHEEFDPARFVKTYEWAVTQGVAGEDKRQRLEDIIEDTIFERPDMAVELYPSLVESNILEVRLVAVGGLKKVFRCDPEVGGQVWNNLLNDQSPDVGEAAYWEFADLCAAIEGNLEHDRELGPIYGLETDTKV